MKVNFSIVAENRPDILARITTLFAGKRYPIEKLLMLPHSDAGLVQILIASDDSRAPLEHMIQQLDRLIEVLHAEVTDQDAFEWSRLPDSEPLKVTRASGSGLQ
ncbi:MAG: ACT domain-containing protein [Acidobacteriota bacterium]